MCLSRFCLNGEGRKDKKFRSLEVRHKLIALKNRKNAMQIKAFKSLKLAVMDLLSIKNLTRAGLQ